MPGLRERLSKRRDEKKARRKARATDPRKVARRSRIDDVEGTKDFELSRWSPKDH